MQELEKNTIDVGRNPGQAIERISNPLLDDLLGQVNLVHQPALDTNMHIKGDLEGQATRLNAEIYDN